MFDHVTIRVSDRQASEGFYETVLASLGIEKTFSDDYFAEWRDFSLAPASEGKPVTRRLHLGFAATSRDQVDEFWRKGKADGYRDDGPPELRPQYREDYYGAFLLDPDGNSAEGVHHGAMRTSGAIDHLWIRVADVEAASQFYETIAPNSGFELATRTADRVRFAGTGGSFSLVRGRPTENVHIAFPAGENSTVDDFYRVARRAGYADNGPPGERPVYHPGYYGAFVLDPDGNNIEVVSHNR